MSMRAWVFPEDKLQPALDRWRASHGDLVGKDDLDMVVAGIQSFLVSPEALKLRVKECEPSDEPAAPVEGRDYATVLTVGG